MGSRQRNKALVELSALADGAAPGGRLSGDGRKPEVVAGGRSRTVGLLDRKARHEGSSAFGVPGLSGLERYPRGPGLDYRSDVGMATAVATAAGLETG